MLALEVAENIQLITRERLRGIVFCIKDLSPSVDE